MIAEFKEREKTRKAQLEAVAQAKHAEKAAAAAHALAHASAGVLRVRLLLGWKQPVTICGDRRARKLRGPWLWCRPWWWTVPLLVAASMNWVPSDWHQFGLPLTRRAHPLGRPAASCGRTTLWRTACSGRPSPLPAGRQRCGTTSSAVPSVVVRKNGCTQGFCV